MIKVYDSIFAGKRAACKCRTISQRTYSLAEVSYLAITLTGGLLLASTHSGTGSLIILLSSLMMYVLRNMYKTGNEIDIVKRRRMLLLSCFTDCLVFALAALVHYFRTGMISYLISGYGALIVHEWHSYTGMALLWFIPRKVLKSQPGIVARLDSTFFAEGAPWRFSRNESLGLFGLVSLFLGLRCGFMFVIFIGVISIAVRVRSILRSVRGSSCLQDKV